MGRILLVCDSGATDKLQTLAMVASGAVTNDVEVYIFFMHDAVYALKKDAPTEPDVTSVFPEVAEKVNQARKEGKIVHWKELLEDLKELGDLTITACVQITEILGLEKADLLPFVDDIVGVSSLAEQAMLADRVISF